MPYSLAGLAAVALVVIGILILVGTVAASHTLGVVLLVVGLLLLFGGGYGYTRR